MVSDSMIKTKSVYSPINHQRDGLRVLVTRFRGRGLPKNKYDVWMPNLGPSENCFGMVRLAGRVGRNSADITGRDYLRREQSTGRIERSRITDGKLPFVY